MTTRDAILDGALEVLRCGDPLTLDAVASRAGLTKPGLVHHFRTKEVLAVAVVEHVALRWLDGLRRYAGESPSPVERLRAYIRYTMTEDIDASDLALLADAKLSVQLVALWDSTLSPWIGEVIDASPADRARYRAARLAADGAWFDRALGVVSFSHDDLADVLEVALSLTVEPQSPGGEPGPSAAPPSDRPAGS
ncbi:TetR/AcrR family transcriptional regulator [Brevibacterium jeotgali]|uniref:Transcriptional regulator, TetR family n=1 Tax=Brevibacterium jeotgali TaxID=1262550 RepID=A0A2H1L693_9MICO|nr:TetR/AcrR family transcriptional regulator [Brevibacterium jeotgali]TWB98893.1 TetR family transcriptional regulator [Brevibacterium jeotgali]SMY12275.1 transcriptional regulator, TetR family [Brevibacterium jeotgali]